MTIEHLCTLIEGKPLTTLDTDRTVVSGYTCDLLSWVMAKGSPDAAWITVQTHMNVVAVAALHDMACIILPENITMEGAPLEKAEEEGIAVLTSPKSAYEICGIMMCEGIPASE
ncbi:MAG TPA: AraC family transcriptional regulator [Clostridiales bacterium]|jgi:hypothetical protein|nr:AraC family transcriptional regulator [Clostridiales bacterium]